MPDTIAALATPDGAGGIAIIRVSGPRAQGVLGNAFRSRTKGALRPRQLRLGWAVDGDGEHIDEAMAVFFPAPHSYTYEDVLEIHCHGGRAQAARVLERVFQLGARPAEPGEFTRRAFENGRIDLSQAEAVMALVGASGDAAARAAMRQLSGGASAFVRGACERLNALIAHVEAANDFPDEIDVEASARFVAEGARKLADELLRGSDGRRARVLREGFSAVLVGVPNVGKSSLMNAMLRADRAIVTEHPGTTRDVLTERLSVDGLVVELSDTAGQREGAGPIEEAGIRRALDAERQADLVIVVCDGQMGVSDSDREIARRAGDRALMVVNKWDLAPPGASAPEGAIRTSAATGEGVDELIAAIRSRALAIDPEGAALVADRHLVLTRSAAASLSSAAVAIENGAPLDVAAVDLWEALRFLREITGEDASERVLDAIFSTFCVGK